MLPAWGAPEVRKTMGVSIYYTATRPRLLTPAEQTAIDAAVAGYPIDTLITECEVGEDEFDGEAFCVYPIDSHTEAGVVFEGATKLPLCSQDAMWAAVQYWCRLLSEMRQLINGANWRIHIDDHDIHWGEEIQAYDPSE
jgi:hypothetical protein